MRIGVSFKLVTMALFAVMLSVLSGCQSPELYQEQAANRARKFLFENATELSERDIAFVRFSTPVFLVDSIISGTDDLSSMQRNLGNAKIREAELTQERSQIAITWLIPGHEKAYMVCGISARSMMYWQPTKLIRRSLKTPDINIQNATSSARKFILHNQAGLLPLTDGEFVRYNRPEIKLSSFDWSGGLPQPSDKFQGKKQVTIFWESGVKPGVFWVAVGSADDDKLTNWSAVWSGSINQAEIDERTMPIPDTESTAQTPPQPTAPTTAGSLFKETE